MHATHNRDVVIGAHLPTSQNSRLQDVVCLCADQMAAVAARLATTCTSEAGVSELLESLLRECKETEMCDIALHSALSALLYHIRYRWDHASWATSALCPG